MSTGCILTFSSTLGANTTIVWFLQPILPDIWIKLNPFATVSSNCCLLKKDKTNQVKLTNITLISEQEEEIEEEERFVCECGRSYRHKRSLSVHKRLECGKEPKFECKHCPFKTKRKNALKNHMLLQHVYKINV